jgi:hypothetical protein
MKILYSDLIAIVALVLLLFLSVGAEAQNGVQTFPGTMCVPLGRDGELRAGYGGHGEIANISAFPITVICPIIMGRDSRMYTLDIDVFNQHPRQVIVCAAHQVFSGAQITTTFPLNPLTRSFVGEWTFHFATSDVDPRDLLLLHL